MMRWAFLFAAPLVMAQNASVKTVPEGIHSFAKGPALICNVQAASPAEFESKVRAQVGARSVGETNEFFIYEGPAELPDVMIQWVFAKPTNYAYPMATCRRAYVESGATLMDRKMRCKDTREDCDRAITEFNALDQQAIAAVRARAR